MVAETKPTVTYILKNFRLSRPIYYGIRVVFFIHDKILLIAWESKRASDHIEWIRVITRDGPLNLVNVYNPPGHVGQPQLEKWPEIAEILCEIGQENVILLGDFNCHYPAWGGTGTLKELKVDHLLLQTEQANLQLLNEQGVITWKRNQSQSVIDLAFASPEIALRILLYYLRPEWSTM
ncbi:hypothetical protein P152DRAFT_500810 [Eremomyces bilateralis CBS 781.70]|uniref:Endonuclease/exonuclease/phosphatase domain-containing protein n=1 Tax=Eremomyces bilateralis CBS 781.70 TaxID=1392243 RepID=A0A6G1FQC8_9PEZI|nr:uncharacterized protein P152DRAFT_500810 [Eremomyces bilateralis CBS 781.70]KAF1807910.1 hypothetical protein P152DRAFT_500810 [Eremomyces bilateralis CBS 781.70]